MHLFWRRRCRQITAAAELGRADVFSAYRSRLSLVLLSISSASASGVGPKDPTILFALLPHCSPAGSCDDPDRRSYPLQKHPFVCPLHPSQARPFEPFPYRASKVHISSSNFLPKSWTKLCLITIPRTLKENPPSSIELRCAYDAPLRTGARS